MIVKLDSWNVLGADATRIRQAVFCEEQGIPPEEEWDQWDAVSAHAVAYDDAGDAVATGRLLPDGHIGRMAVLKSYRGQGFGGAVLEKLIASVTGKVETSYFRNRKPKITALQLHAQTQVKGFYLRYGFVAMGANFLEVGIPHVLMCRNVE